MVKSADRVGRILSLVSHKKGGVRHAQISSALNIPTSSLSHLLASLVNQDLLSLDTESRKYLLGPQIIILAGRYIDNFGLIENARPVIQKLARETGESSALAMQVGWDVVIAFSEDSQHLSKQFIPLRTVPMFVTASGKALLAHKPAKELNQYLASKELVPITSKTITDQAILRAELETVRDTGFAYSREELHEGMIAIATPVYDLYNKAFAAITIKLPVTHFSDEKEAQLKHLLSEASHILSHKLGLNN